LRAMARLRRASVSSQSVGYAPPDMPQVLFGIDHPGHCLPHRQQLLEQRLHFSQG